MTKTQIADALDRIKQIAESLDDAITKLAIAVEKDEKTETAQPVAEPAKPVTLEDVRAALTTLAGVKGAAHVKGLLADYGAKKLSELGPIHFTAVLLAAQAEATAND